MKVSKELTDRYEKILNERIELKLRLASITTEQIELLKQIYHDRYGVLIGSVVTVAGEEHLVTRIGARISSSPTDKPWLMGVPRKKNGEWSKREVHLYANWEVEA